MGNSEKETPKQFRFKKTEKDGITETMRVFTGDEQPAITEEQPILTDDDLDGDFDLPEETALTSQPNPNPDKITDTIFDLRSLPPTAIKKEPASAQPAKELTEFKLGLREGEQTIQSRVQEVAEKQKKVKPPSVGWKNFIDDLKRRK